MRVLITCLLALLASSASAANCTVSAQPVAFGNYASPNGSQTDTTGTVTVACSSILAGCPSYTISLSQGTAGSYSPRKLASGANRLNYNLYTSAARTTVWGDGSGGSATVHGDINGGLELLGICLITSGSNPHTVYGRIPASQNVPAGSYGDTITVTVTY